MPLRTALAGSGGELAPVRIRSGAGGLVRRPLAVAGRGSFREMTTRRGGARGLRPGTTQTCGTTAGGRRLWSARVWRAG
jgi:hypothetical protein